MKRRGAIAALLGLVPLVWAAACVRPPSPSPVTPAGSSSIGSGAAGARWDYHPQEPKRLRARLDLGRGVRLFVGDSGERWLVDAAQGMAEAASSLADEDLIAVARPSPNDFAFVGARGTIYRADTPLGPLSVSTRPSPAIWAPSAAGTLIVGIRYDGTAVRSNDGGRTFAPISGVAARIVDAKVAPDGRAMLLGSPESLWISRDGGATFVRAAVEPVGAASLMADAGGALVARGVTKTVIWAESGEPAVTTVSYAIEPPAMDLLTDVDAGPSARAVASGRAAILGGRYFEAVAPTEDKGPWELASGGLTGRTLRAVIAGSSDCRKMLVSGGGRSIALICTSRATKDDSILFPPLRLIVSRDGGTTFEPVSTGLVADEEDTHVAVSNAGTLLVTGACKPQQRGICAPGAPMRLVPSTTSKKLRIAETEPSKVPPILGRTGHVVRAPTGERLYATATLLAERRAAVLISDDDGKTFEAVPIDVPREALDAGAADGGTGAEGGLVALASDALTVDGAGRLSIVGQTGAGQRWIVLDSSGHVLSSRLVPSEYTTLAVVGERGLAVAGKTGEVFESMDGGATFHLAGRLPRSEMSSDETAALTCVEQGCLVGESFSRVGWGPTQQGGSLEPGPKERPAGATQRTPIVCDVVPGSGGDISGAVFDIDAFDGDRGAVAWGTHVLDRAKASLEVIHGARGPAQGIEREQLFPAGKGEGVAIAVRTQAEGMAALRYRFERGADGRVKVGSPLRQVEIAWDHQLKGKVFHATIADAGPATAQDVLEVRKGEAVTANIGMLSVSDDGVFVCPHATCEQVYFMDERGRGRRVSLPEMPHRGYGDRMLAPRDYAVRAGGADVFVDVILDGGTLMRARPSDHGPAAMDALTLLPATAQANGFRATLTWAFDGSALAGMTFTASHAEHEGYAELLRFSSPTGVALVQEADTQTALGDPPRPCTEQQRVGTLRTLLPPQAASRHPVVVRSEGGAVYVLQSDYAVVYGAKGSACVSTIDTVAAAGTSGNVGALINAVAMDRSWLFSPAPGGGLRWRALRCAYQPGAAIPEPHAPAPVFSSAPAAPSSPVALPPPLPFSVPAGSVPPPGIPSAVWALIQSSGALSAFPPGAFPPIPAVSAPSSARRPSPWRSPRPTPTQSSARPPASSTPRRAP